MALMLSGWEIWHWECCYINLVQQEHLTAARGSQEWAALKVRWRNPMWMLRNICKMSNKMPEMWQFWQVFAKCKCLSLSLAHVAKHESALQNYRINVWRPFRTLLSCLMIRAGSWLTKPNQNRNSNLYLSSSLNEKVQIHISWQLY